MLDIESDIECVGVKTKSESSMT